MIFVLDSFPESVGARRDAVRVWAELIGGDEFDCRRNSNLRDESAPECLVNVEAVSQRNIAVVHVFVESRRQAGSRSVLASSK